MEDRRVAFSPSTHSTAQRVTHGAQNISLSLPSGTDQTKTHPIGRHPPTRASFFSFCLFLSHTPPPSQNKSVPDLPGAVNFQASGNGLRFPTQTTGSRPQSPCFSLPESLGRLCAGGFLVSEEGGWSVSWPRCFPVWSLTLGAWNSVIECGLGRWFSPSHLARAIMHHAGTNTLRSNTQLTHHGQFPTVRS